MLKKINLSSSPSASCRFVGRATALSKAQFSLPSNGYALCSRANWGLSE
jgi:hypothetical protein